MRLSLRRWLGILSGVGLLVLGLGLSCFFWQQAQVAAAANRPVYALPQPVGFPAPEIALIDLQGRPVSLADYRGQVVVVNNWATWCPPCKAEMPDLQAYYDAHQSQGLALVAVDAGEGQDVVAAFVAEQGLSFAIWLDPNDQMLRVLRNNRLPNSFVVDRQGVVRLAWTGPTNLEILEQFVTPMLEE